MISLNSILEDIATGTGSSFNAGAGEQVASPFAFKKRIRRRLKEAPVEISYTPEKRKETYEKLLKEFPEKKKQVERYINQFEAFDIKGLMDETEKASKFAQIGEKFESELGKADDILSDMAEDAYESNEKREHDELKRLSEEYYKLKRTVYRISDAMEDIIRLIEKIKEKENNQ